MDFNNCAECRWQQYCYNNPETWDLSPEEYEEFMRKKNQCDAELLSSCFLPVENELEASANEEITEIIKKYSG